MSQLIVILILVIAIVRTVAAKGNKGRGAKPMQKSVRTGQAGAGPETATAEAPRRARERTHGRVVSPRVKAESVAGMEAYAEPMPCVEPPAEPIACGNEQEHSHARAAEVGMSIDDLRRVVITSEILSKPVSLRDE